jgi:hypothetical protein
MQLNACQSREFLPSDLVNIFRPLGVDEKSTNYHKLFTSAHNQFFKRQNTLLLGYRCACQITTSSFDN